MHEDAAGHGWAQLGHTGIQHGMLHFLQRHIQAVRQALAEGLLAHPGQEESPHQELRRRGLASQHGRGEVDVRGGPHLLVDALERVEALEHAQFQQAGEGRPQVAAHLILGPLLGGWVNAELHEPGVSWRLRQRHADLSNAGRFQELSLPGEDALAALQHLLQLGVGVVEEGAVRDAWESIASHDDVKEVDRDPLHAALQLDQRSQQLLIQLEPVEVCHDGEKAMAVVLLLRGHREELCPNRRLRGGKHLDLGEAARGGQPGKVGVHGALLDLRVRVAERLHQELHLEAAVHGTRELLVHGLQAVFLKGCQLLTEVPGALLVRLLGNGIQQLLGQVPDVAIVSGHSGRAGQLRELHDLFLHSAGHVILQSEVGDVHAGHAGALGCQHLADQGHHGVGSVRQLVVSGHHEEDLLHRILALVDQVQQELVVRLLLFNGGCEGPLIREVLLQHAAHGLGRRLAVGEAREHLLHKLGPLLVRVVAVQKGLQILAGGGHVRLGLGAHLEVSLEEGDLLHLRGVLQLKVRQNFPGRDDGARAQGMGNLPGLTGLQ
mmetsp:Transcript_32469/g.75826  ORF Transcript_32469/g.75826 Transcript_32469/m.75826 type:complete len:549 (-) Transcript_32469:887-2533(-)